VTFGGWQFVFPMSLSGASSDSQFRFQVSRRKNFRNCAFRENYVNSLIMLVFPRR